MSHTATNWAVKVRGITAAEARVLWHLADCHNPVLGCYPSQEYLADAAEMDIRSVRRILGNLKEKALIAWEEARAGNRRDNNRYRLAFEPDFEPDKLPGSDQASTGQIDPSEPDKNDGLNRTLESAEPVIEPVKEPERERAREPGKGKSEAADPRPAPGTGARAEAFEADWTSLKRAWPDVALEAHDSARAKLAALSAAERRAAIAAVPAFVAFHREKRGKRPLPFLVNYLAEKRWEDLPRPRHGGADAPAQQAFVGAFDRPWWWVAFDWIARHGSAIRDRDGSPAREFRKRVELALSVGVGWGVPAADLERIEAAALAMVKAPADGEAFVAWRSYIAARFGADLPLPTRTSWVWLPALSPDGWPDGSAMAEERNDGDDGGEG